ncbi:MAG: adenosine deaminase [Gemmatimonadales bacterium]|jgi:adenosine deaminase|nr:MAG: adenosine deaminase [Gemmatimonadales bacterium]
MSDDFIRRLPKPELHVHLDGSLRPETLLELAREVGLRIPARDPEAVADFMRADESRDLEDYLRRFEVTLAVLQSEPALERAAYELVLDAAAENTRYLEIRYSPVLNTRDGLTLDEVLDASLRGMVRGMAETGVRGGIVVCALRSLSPEVSTALAELAVSYRGRGVVGFDLAGGEAGHPAREHAEAFTVAARGGVPRTVHAGEAWGPESIREALVEGRAQRIGHGTRLQEDPLLEEIIRDQQIPVEVCLTSNLQTRVTASYAEHPLRRYYDLGIPVTICTDNRLVSGTTLVREYEAARDHLGFSGPELALLAWNGFKGAFLDWPARSTLLSAVAVEMEELGVPLP